MSGCGSEKCTGCGACVQICPDHCIELIPNQEGFLQPHIDESCCRQCGLCEQHCPALGKQMENPPLFVCGAYAKDQGTLQASSSGGIFTILSNYILNQGGVVFGAAFCEDFQSVRHIVVKRKEELFRLRGSKYVQSDLSDSFQKTKEFLEFGRPVLFSGTPCQIAGLKAYLKSDDPNLFTQDVICHGVPSPKVWNAYLRELRADAHSDICNFQFRDKSRGWKNYGLQITFQNGNEKWESQTDNPYFRCFLHNISLRDCCYKCPYKGNNYYSDITLGDFWGARHVIPEIDDYQGVSLVLVRSEKAAGILDKVKREMIVYSVDEEKSLLQNVTIFSPTEMSPKRTVFFEQLENEHFRHLVNILDPLPIRQRIINRIPERLKQFIKHILKRNGKSGFNQRTAD